MEKKFNGSKSDALSIRTAAARLLGGEAPPNPRLGVCCNLDKFAPGCGAYELVEDAAETWPHTIRYLDGRPYAYFVPKDDGYGNWEGPNLEMRRDLLRHIIAYVDSTFGVDEVVLNGVAYKAQAQPDGGCGGCDGYPSALCYELPTCHNPPVIWVRTTPEAESYTLELTWSEAQFLRDVLGDAVCSDGEGTAIWDKLMDMGFKKGASRPGPLDLRGYEGQRKPD